MNKLSKGLIVSGLGAALLLGTGGSLALWNVSAESNAGTIATGDLNLSVNNADQSWAIKKDGAWVTIADITTFKMVPGDEVRLTQPMDVTLVGNHMKASMEIDTSNAFTHNPATGSDVSPYISVDTTFVNNPAGATAPVQNATTGAWEFTQEFGTKTFTQEVVFTFSDQATGRAGANAAIDLGNTEFVLSQY